MEAVLAALVIILIGVIAFAAAMRAINEKLADFADSLPEDEDFRRHWGR